MKSLELVQSYIFTVARYDFDAYQKRFFYRLIEMLVPDVNEEINKKLNFREGYFYSRNFLGDYEVTMPCQAILNGEEDKNHSLLKKSLRKLQTIGFDYDDGKYIHLLTVIYKPKIEKYGRSFTCHVDALVIDAILNVKNGFSKYDLQTTFNFKSIYAMRLYELMYAQKKEITYTIDYLREMFCVGDKYKETKDFIKRTIEIAKIEIDKSNSDRSFSYKKNIGKYGKIESITFYPLKSEELIVEQLMKTTSLRFDVEKHVIEYLRTNFGFKDSTFNTHRKVFRDARKADVDVLNLAAVIKSKEGIKKPIGYLINAIKQATESALNKK